MMTKKYMDLRRLQFFLERYNYLRLGGAVGESTFGYDRYINQALYTSQRWRQARDKVIIRDNGCDLGIEDYKITGSIVVHHMNPITLEDIELGRPKVFSPEFLICTSSNTHNAIHYGDDSLLPKMFIERKRDDTCLWR